MNREIRFRAWDINRKIMVNVMMLYFPHWVRGFVPDRQHYDFYEEGCGDYTINNFELMQYTGLKDKTDTEIYEFDIVKSDYVVFEDIGITTQTGIVVFNQQQCSFTVNTFDYMDVIKGFRENCYQTMDKFNLMDCQIIGNVYENPELLEKS